jgi:hypothetical protein
LPRSQVAKPSGSSRDYSYAKDDFKDASLICGSFSATSHAARCRLERHDDVVDRMRENGISHRLTAPRSPTTTGKIERFHQA